MSNFSNYKKFENLGINSSNNTLIVMDSSNNNISLHSSDGEDHNVDTLSIKNIINKKQNMDLNLSSLNGNIINPVITINNNHSDCKIMTNLNVIGNVNIDNNLIIPSHDNSSLLSNTYGSIYYNTSENMYKGYTDQGWQSFGGLSKTEDVTIYKNLNVNGNINLTNGEMIQTTGIGSFGSINCGVGIFTNLNISGNLNLPVGITSSRPSNPNPGTIRYNSETYLFEGYFGLYGGIWVSIGTLPLFAFTSHTFTNCGATGRYGPTFQDMKNAYAGPSWVTNTDYFNSDKNGYQIWTVPERGTYSIKAYGARGGKKTNTVSSWGLGAWTQGFFYLNKGTKLLIIVGQHGNDNASAGGGGGATWVLQYGASLTAVDSILYCVAGGGGGEAYNNQSTRDNENGGNVQNGLVTYWLGVKSRGQGNVSTTYWQQGGGASYGIEGGVGAGNQDYQIESAKPPINNSVGADHPTGHSAFGFGGFGGGGNSGVQYAGGGGGYVGGNSGGQGIHPADNDIGGVGGSSRNNGSLIEFGNHSNDHGKVTITKL